MNDIESRLLAIKEQITSHARQAGRSPNEIKLLAVSKTKPVEAIQEAYQAGQRLFGESYVQEAITKIQQLNNSSDYAGIEWHFIGPLQSNKTKLVAEHFDWVHSIDREKTAQRLNEQRPANLPALNVCIQVNISGERTKSGITADEVFGLAGIISEFPHLKLRGLMTIAENTDDLDVVRDNFLHMQELFNRLKNQYPSVDTLSMGMTDDMSVAISSGSTMVRIGTAIFGSREYK
ncbi:alanine racemase domain protein [Tolumonas auensis DSM 9187]|jgi:pyridoxal phosphate enzyme (YggS family)|uniref:Pyridoxal phosphate homeostasis protein n=1 Tax=Tolumonas auensis (strain DSM 9187 / NBRC 110442 / TA 4) TaxID=595494 RepID=C4LCM9_TOLAT|nr:YggS family pyridoxal phosphate-dependent enzyme [Tolumonas auensis]ACQ92593.1 alanine racemase domain protein [Tolumonas auensis DSM 9187]